MTTKPVAGGQIRGANTPAPYVVSAAASGNLTTGSSTPADIPGATITITTVQNNASVLVNGVFDIMTATAANVAAIGTCLVDGAVQTAEAIRIIVTAQTRETVAQNWPISLPTPGSHTIKFQGACGGGSATFNQTHTTLTALVLDW